jgi:hypothetical protein
MEAKFIGMKLIQIIRDMDEYMTREENCTAQCDQQAT